MREHGLADRAHGFGCPTAAHVIDPPKARLVLERHFDRVRLWEDGLHLLDLLGEFFSRTPVPGGYFGGGVCPGPASANHADAADYIRRTAPSGVPVEHQYVL